jgi:hypothetical protein
MPDALDGLFRLTAARCAEPQRRAKTERKEVVPYVLLPKVSPVSMAGGKPWERIEQALRVADLLLQAGGFSTIVLDMGALAAEQVSRVPLATWFRYRAAAERTQASVVLLTQYACAKSSAGLVLRMAPGRHGGHNTVLVGTEHRVEVERMRFAKESAKVVPMRRQPQRESGATWRSRTTWAGA